jgi:ABC-type nitrate/sulfonate/bicarbonate transport system substrate-binding protein
MIARRAGERQAWHAFCSDVPTMTDKESFMSAAPSPDDDADPACRTPVTRLWYTRSPVPTPLGLAAQLGWFRDEFRDDGIGVFTLQRDGDARMRASHYDHHLPHSFRQGGNVGAIWARARGRATRVIGLNWVDEFQAVVTMPGRGITTPRELRGRRLALPRHAEMLVDHERASSVRGFSVALDLAGIAEREVAFVDVDIVHRRDGLLAGTPLGPFAGYGDQAYALMCGHVDAIFVKGSHGVQAVAELGAEVLLDIRTHPDPLVRANHGAPRPVTVDQELLDLRPDLVARFLSRIVAAGDWAAAHPAETFAYVARETGSAEKWMRPAYGVDLHLHQRTDLDATAIAALDAYKDFLYARGFIDSQFDTREWIAEAPLAAVRNTRSARAA